MDQLWHCDQGVSQIEPGPGQIPDVMKIFVPHPDEEKREQQWNSQDGPHTACRPEYEGLQKGIGQNYECASQPLCLGNPPGSQDIPQKESDKGEIKQDIRVPVMKNIFFQLKEGRPGNKDHKEKRRENPGGTQQKTARQGKGEVFSDVRIHWVSEIGQKISLIRRKKGYRVL